MATSIFDRQPWLKDVIMQRIEAQQQAMENANKNANMAPWMPLITAGGLLGGNLIMDTVKDGGGLSGLLGLGGADAATSGITNAVGGSAPSMPTILGGSLSGASGLGSGLLSAGEAGLANTGGAIQAVAPGALGATSGLGSVLGTALPIAGTALGAYGMYDAFTDPGTKSETAMQGGLSGLGAGAGIGMLAGGPLGALVGGGIGALTGGGLGGFFGKDKPHPETQDRRDIIDQLKQSGFLGAGGEVQGGGTIGDARNPSTYNLDPAKNTPDQVMGQTVGMTAPLAAILTNGASAKAREDTTGMLVNAVKDSANPYDRVKDLYAKAGLDRNTAYTKIGELASAGKLTDQERDSAFAAIDQLFNVRNPNAPKDAQARFDQFQQARGKPQNLDAWKGVVNNAINPNAPANQQIPVGQPGDTLTADNSLTSDESSLFAFGNNAFNRGKLPPLSQKEIQGGMTLDSKGDVVLPGSRQETAMLTAGLQRNQGAPIDWTEILRRIRGRQTA
jgi:hypothetical protein